MSEKPKKVARQNWEKNGILEGIFDHPPEDEDVDDIVRNKKKKLERPAAPAKPCVATEEAGVCHACGRATRRKLRGANLRVRPTKMLH